MKKIIFINLFLAITIFGFAQKQTFDMVSFDIPKGWDKTVTENGVQLSTKDDGKGNYAAMVIVRSVASNAPASDNFNKSWENLVKGTVKVTEAPSMSDMDIEKGWNVITGQANYTDGAAKGLVTLITATGNEKMANVVIMTNTDKYQEEILAFVNSLEINEPATEQNNTSNTNITTTVVHDNSPLTGKIWEAQTLEKFGSSGNSNYSGGFRKYQYKFNANGSYQFVYCAASGLANNPLQLLQYETGTYTVNGNQLTITPLKGANEEWSVGKINNGMGAELIRKVLKTRLTKLKSSARKLEKITYPFTIEYWQGNEANALCLKHTQNTIREGSPGQNDQSCFFETTASKAEIFNGLFK